MLTEVQPVIDNQIQFDRVVGYLLRNEILHAVFDLKDAGFVGITDQRVIFYDQDVIATGKPKKMVSIPYHQIIGVAASDNEINFKTDEVVLITAAGQFDFEFDGADKALWVYRFIMNQILNQTR